ncbi:hypothetical protein CCR95_16645 [Thiocystis minor]|nr:hypothetical protein [Thiocystis minor]
MQSQKMSTRPALKSPGVVSDGVRRFLRLLIGLFALRQVDALLGEIAQIADDEPVSPCPLPHGSRVLPVRVLHCWRDNRLS